MEENSNYVAITVTFYASAVLYSSWCICVDGVLCAVMARQRY